MEKAKQITIIGAGLSGLMTAYLLKKAGLTVRILEASGRIGGRVHTQEGKLGTPLELGATWFSDQHVRLTALVAGLGLAKFPQFSEGVSFLQTARSFEPAQQIHVPATNRPSYRIAGGTQALIEALIAAVGIETVVLHCPVTQVVATADGLTAYSSNGKSFLSDAIVTCLPPQLVASKIVFIPALPASIREILPTVQTWMAGSVKFTIEYKAHFWRDRQLSGMLYSHAGTVVEMYDHTNYDGDRFGFTGFLNADTRTYTQEIRRAHVLRQLQEAFGNDVLDAVAYYDKVWDDEYVLSDNPAIKQPHQNNGHPCFQQAYMDGRLFFSGSETSPLYGGYMEGAVIAAERTVDRIVKGRTSLCH
ncbi:flavin monoamine oxidase family protein [Dinghuibacter silviterrae]|uniref:Monoamine oxidase n=1 Tax=Dinghuibacter silviterrae TaxID=1539049 RepID=A0A4R8DMM8_9BACT|nr:NAD(P)/FAD-dependent oxidoreductase [Dinghuibacter silviterrae]TDW99008.1 monoamine oxidase [Dinghuibacter silviterrae]